MCETAGAVTAEMQECLVGLTKDNYRKRELHILLDEWFWADRMLLCIGYWFSDQAKEDFPTLLEEK